MSANSIVRSRSGHAQRNELTAELLCRAAIAEGLSRQRLIDQVIQLNSGLAEAIARRFCVRGVEYRVVAEVARAGLVTAAQEFNPADGKDFFSFAVPAITGDLKTYLRVRGAAADW